MTSALERVRNSRDRIGSALPLCGGSLDALARAIEHLQEVGVELRAIESDYRSTGVFDPDGLFRQELALLRRDLGTVARLIDFGATAYRGFALRIGANSVAYTPRGCQSAGDPTPAAMALEV
jgi:hypothetical protein